MRVPLPLPVVAPLKPLTPTEEYVSLLVGIGLRYHDIAAELGVSYTTAKFHTESVAAKLPGELPAYHRVQAWIRGAPLAVLDGAVFRASLHESRQAGAAAVPSTSTPTRASRA